MPEHGDDQCTVNGCTDHATRRLRWPDPGGLVAGFCDDHADKKLGLTHVEEVNDGN